MTTLSDVAAGVARYLAGELELKAQDTETIRFVLELFMGTVINYVVVIMVAWWLGITPYALAVLVTVSIMRLLSGGAHSSTFLRCLVLGTVILVGIAQLAVLVGMQVPPALMFFLVGITVTGGCYVVYKWAPADTPAKPIVSPVKRARYRSLSYIYLAVWAVVVSGLILGGRTGPLFFTLACASMGGLWWQIFSITPAGYQFAVAMETLVDKFWAIFQTKKLPV